LRKSGNIQQDPPPQEDLFFRDIFLSCVLQNIVNDVDDMAIQISSSFLGPRPKMTFLSGNTALKSTESQPVHSDADFDHPQIPFALVVNVPLISMTPANGSTEIWLGTHTHSGLHVQEGRHGDRASGRIKSEILEARRKEFPPMQPVIPKGSIIIRDLRLWHCGKPNMEGTTRVMLAMIHFASWYRNPMRFVRLWMLC
jgi:ectoine hydroxylase-related dioxygenase (phytanoyl-CoA dioxygenase family)